MSNTATIKDVLYGLEFGSQQLCHWPTYGKGKALAWSLEPSGIKVPAHVADKVCAMGVTSRIDTQKVWREPLCLAECGMNLADKIGAAQVIARGLERQNDDLVDAVIARYGADAASLATDPDFHAQLNDYVRRNPITGVWWPVGYDEDDEDDEWDWDAA